MSFFSINKEALLRLTPVAAVEYFRDLLWARARDLGVPITDVSISSDIFTADGGIDASILGDVALTISDELLTGGPRFQLKTGDSEPWQPAWVKRELFGTKEANKVEHLGAAVRRCLDEHGRYVFVCFGVDLLDENRRHATENFVRAFQDCGYTDPSVDVWGQSQLIGLFQPYRSLCLRLMGRDHFELQSHQSWSRGEDMQPKLHLGPEQHAIVEEIREHLRTGDVSHVRLIGEPGVGKSRLALEATRTEDLAPLVLYFRDGATFQRNSLFNELLQPDESGFTVLVIDECLRKDSASIWNVLKPRAGRLRLITIDHGPDDSADDGMKVIDVLPSGKEQIAAIISDYGIEKRDAERWSAECEGCPRVAHVIGENLRANRSNLFQTPATLDDVWARFIVRHDDPASEEVELRKIVLRHVALFERFGFDSPVAEEAKFIADLACKCDPRLTWPRFQSIVYELKRHRILQGVTTLYITPPLLHFYLYREFWEHHGRDLDLAAFLQSMPQLWHWFVGMLPYAHLSTVAEKAVDCLLGPSGLFPEDRIPDSQDAGRLLMALAETNAKPTLGCLQRLIGKMEVRQLSEFREARQSVVWALEQIAVWEDCFTGAAELLLRLAEAENSNNSNNATETFKSLFSLIPGMAATQAKPPQRLQVLRQALASTSSKQRIIGLGACETAFATSSGFRIVGPEHQGLRKTIEFWYPQTNAELWNACGDVWRLLIETLSEWQGEDRVQLIRTVITSAWSALHVSPLTSAVLESLEGLPDDPLTDIKSLVSFIKRQLRYRDGTLSKDTADRLRTLNERLDGHDFTSKLRRYVKHGTWEDSVNDDGKPTNVVDQKFEELAQEATSIPDLLTDELSWLICEDSSSAFCFAYRLGILDPERRLLPTLLRVQESQHERAGVSFISGYLASIYERNAGEWESRMLELAAHSAIRNRFSDFVIRSGISDNTTRKVIQLCRDGQFDVGRLEH